MRRRRIKCGWVAGMAAAGWLGASNGSFAQEVPFKDSPAKAEEPAAVTAEGVPVEATESEQGVRDVEQAMDVAEAKTREGLPDEFVMKFGDVHDWMRLTSGEWLKGRLKRMRDEQVDFDSDKLDLVTFDWDDVDRLHCPGVNTYVFVNKLDVVGRALVTKDKVLIETATGVESHPRKNLLSIVDGEPRERNWWSTRLGVGFSANAGNTNQGSLSAYFEVVRADYRTRTELRYDGTIGYANGEKNVSRHIGTPAVRLFLSQRWYFTPATAQLLNDQFQNIRFRATPGAGAGVHLFRTKRWEWDLDAGLGYQYLDFLSSIAGVRNPQNDGFVSFGTWASLEFYKDVVLEIEWRTNLVYTTIGNTNHTGRAEFSVDITDIFDFAASLLFLRTEQPVPRSDGTVPAKNDYQVLVSVALEID